MLKNVQEAKFRNVLVPIAMRTLSRSAMVDVNFSSFFTHILAHELMHGLGPHQITVGGGTQPAGKLKELIQRNRGSESRRHKLFALQYMMDHASELKLGAIALRRGGAAPV
jgi:hypothetical protein